MRESQYVDSYLYAAGKRRWTPKTYLAYELKGRAKTYGAGYESALQRALDRRVRAGKVVPVTSVGRKVAYMWAEDAERLGITSVETK
jgi:hypothetical protein